MDEKASPGADLAWSLAWIAFGAAVVYGSWTMDRLEKMHINPYTAPGLVPGLLGVGLLVMGGMLLARSVRAGGLRARQAGDEASAAPAGLGRLWLALLLCLGYGAGLVGHGMPFWAATFLFVFAAITLFQWPERRARGEFGRGLAVAAACAAATAAGVTLLFQELFLVNLP
jgi:hypothetical protein